MAGRYTLADVLATRKSRDSWWTVYLVDPLACPVALVVANHTRWTPNGLTAGSLVLGMASAVCFGLDQLVAGAALFYVSFLLDCVDGKIARLKGTGTPFGLWLDYVGDRIRVVCCATGLAYGQFTLTHDVIYVVLGAVVAVLDLFRYVNAPQMKRVRGAILGPPVPGRPASPPEGPRFMPGLNGFLARHRVRAHLISGIEFHAAVFVVAPLTGVLLPIAAVASVLLLANEVFIVYRMWLFTRRVPAVPQESRQHALIGG
ncbi:CDP-alcohol phosphatidyltransferase family protein [Thermoactinospora rubra]|uniref:CDP-alcohol phosphatidyltransferase family protein n=1 Tax=Thermoactinospora rubra TaxID=1088767 RepID=UPI000A101895|nr:CDP-alcohol phosphatidyltransferase family protein [Thermoactinospora rubra]